MSYLLSDYSFSLANDRIAQHPLLPAHNSKLLYVDCASQMMKLSDHHFFDLPALLDSGTLLIANNSQVFASRIILNDVEVILKNKHQVYLNYGELLIVRVLFDSEGNLDKKRCVVWFSDKKHCRPGSTIMLSKDGQGVSLYSKEFLDDGILIELEHIDLIQLCEKYGDMPLPPYITQATIEDKKYYKTSFGQDIGSVATPTAGLHFSAELRERLRLKNINRQEITLHVGIGTFAPVVSDDIRQHQLHAEYITLDLSLFELIYKQKKQDKHIITIGTTTTRTIESLPYLFYLFKDDINPFLSHEVFLWRDEHSLSGGEKYIKDIRLQSGKVFFSSSLFIYPGFEHKIIDGIITNFHLPGTSLVMLVSGLMGYDRRKKCYDYALAKSPPNHYRWASFGDGMLIKL